MNTDKKSELIADTGRPLTGMDAIVLAIEESIAIDYDPLTGLASWSINPHKFWMALSTTGYELGARNDGEAGS